MERRQYVPDGAEFTTAETGEFEQLSGLNWQQKEKRPGAFKRLIRKAGTVGALIGLGVAGEGRMPAASSQDVGNIVRAGSQVTREVGRIYRTKKEAEEAKRRTEAKRKTEEEKNKNKAEAQQQRHEENMSKIDAEKQRTAMEGAIATGGEMEAEVSPDGKTVRATVNPEKARLQKDVMSNKAELVKIYRGLARTNGDFAKMWELMDRAGRVPEKDRQDIEAQWDEIVQILIKQGAIK